MRGGPQAAQGWEKRGGQREGDPGRVGGYLGHVYTDGRKKKNHITIGGGTGTHAPPAPGAPRGAPLSTKVPSEAVRETSQVKHSGAEVQMEVKERQ